MAWNDLTHQIQEEFDPLGSRDLAEALYQQRHWEHRVERDRQREGRAVKVCATCGAYVNNFRATYCAPCAEKRRATYWRRYLPVECEVCGKKCAARKILRCKECRYRMPEVVERKGW